MLPAHHPPGTLSDHVIGCVAQRYLPPDQQYGDNLRYGHHAPLQDSRAGMFMGTFTSVEAGMDQHLIEFSKTNL
ncbi:hypothetical protein GN244_ATG02623 [Phytophthora infestans]|uniref:Uncharacterized protein n=1 Tax=Phytophthora infestans TaxID=4787 RepID=A0A833TBC7_PHYIN|nr:hypothetical protein GN244_ATG02623 [Phytophthora infestans]